MQQYAAVEAVRDRLDEPQPGFYTDPQIRRWINEGVREIARRSEWKRDTSTETVVVGDQDFALDTDIIRIYRVEFTPTGSSLKYKLAFFDHNDLDVIWGPNQSITTGIPEIYTIKSANPMTMEIYPKSAQAGTLTIFHYAMPTDLATNTNADATSTLDVPLGWEDLVVEYATALGFRKARDTQSYALAFQAFTDKVSELVDMAQRGSTENTAIMPDGGAWGAGWDYLGGYGY